MQLFILTLKQILKTILLVSKASIFKVTVIIIPLVLKCQDFLALSFQM